MAEAPPDTPATRTGPPRSLSFAYSIPSSPSFASRVPHHLLETSIEDPELSFSADSHFRGALEYASPNGLCDKMGKSGRDKGKSLAEEVWNPKRRFHESPKEEKAAMDFPLPESESSADETFQPLSLPTSPTIPLRPLSRHTTIQNSKTSSTAKDVLRRAFSVPHSPNESPSHKGKEKEKDPSQGSAKWAKIRSRLPQILYPHQSILPKTSVVTSHVVNITDELITGGLSTFMLRLWFERDEKDHRRVPVLFHRLRIRISDSLHPLQRHKSVFRIECEYANGAARWVIYRELRDFVSLHTHYTVSNVYKRNRDKLPEFPLTSTRLILISLFQSLESPL